MALRGTIAATQKKIDLKFCEPLRIKDGQITEAHVYFDGATLLTPTRPHAADAGAGSAGALRPPDSHCASPVAEGLVKTTAVSRI